MSDLMQLVFKEDRISCQKIPPKHMFFTKNKCCTQSIMKIDITHQLQDTHVKNP